MNTKSKTMPGKVAIVTGASAGIGKATALQLKKEGYKVYAGARRLDKMRDLSNEGINCSSLDVTQEESMVAFVQKVQNESGRIDVLVNNAGYAHFGTIEESPMSIAKAQYDVNVFGLGRMMQLVIPTMREQRSGKIVNISSIGGKMTTPFAGWYQSTKYAVESISDAVRVETKQFGIDVILIEPGIIGSEFPEVAQSQLLSISGKGHYKKSANKVAKTTLESYQKPSPPTVVSSAISSALKAKSPKARYVMGKQAHSILFMKKILSDKMWDRMMTSMVMAKED